MSQVDRNNPRRGSASESRYTFYEFDSDFPDDAAALDWLVGHLYPEGIHCPTCEKVTNHYRVKRRTSYACQFCGHHEYPMKGTIFEGSATSLRLWFHAIYLMAQTRGGISAKQIERELGVTYKTAWRMAKQIRTLLGDDEGPLKGTVEVDETWHGGKRHFPGRPGQTGQQPGYNSLANKTPIVGAVERGGRVKATVVQNVRKGTLIPLVVEHVMDDAMVFTDEHSGYSDLTKRGYVHRRVNHSARVYVDGDVHTNTIEGFWMLLKNGIRGTYHAVGKGYLQSYVDEYSFRYNHRKDEGGMFAAFLSRIEKAVPATS